MSENTFNMYVLIAQRHKVRNYFRKTDRHSKGIEWQSSELSAKAGLSDNIKIDKNI